tara:strand:+ start:57 stop:557 length:501 start_codon:yes stop_codon:yes gene_type:complete
MDNLNLPSPGVIRRLAAIFYDSLLVIAVLMTVSGLAIGIRVIVVGEQAIKSSPSVAVNGVFFQLLLLASIFMFFYVFWRKKGQTLGMQVWRIRLDSNNGKRISLNQALVRFFTATFSALCFGMGFWWIWLDAKNRSWHDSMSNTKLVLLPKKSKNANVKDSTKDVY